MSAEAKVLTGLMERRALESAFQELAEIQSLDRLIEHAQTIAEHGSSALSVLLSLLDTEDPQLRGGLGQVAALLDRNLVVPALYGIARSRNRGDPARLTAMTILDRYLHEPVDESLMASLQDADGVALRSLRELIHEMGRTPFAVIEYLNQLAEQPPEVAKMILNAVPCLPANPHLVTLLRMFAQGQDEGLALAALDQLGRTRSEDAARALASLAATLPPQRATLAERGLRKLRLSGVSESAPSAAIVWRALLSPIDGAGAQVVWFVGRPMAGGNATLFSVLCKDPEGIVASFGSTEAPDENLPPVRPLGILHSIQQAEGFPAVPLLEVPFDAGRQTVREALALNWAGNRLPPLEYRLLNPLIWEQRPVSFRDWEMVFGEPEKGGQEEHAGNGVEQPERDGQSLVALLDHPAFASWFWQSPELYDVAERLGWRHGSAERVAQITALARALFGVEVIASYQRRLNGMARWLALAAQPEAAALAKATAIHLGTATPARSPFVRRLIGIGLDVATANLRRGFDLRHGPHEYRLTRDDGSDHATR